VHKCTSGARGPLRAKGSIKPEPPCSPVSLIFPFPSSVSKTAVATKNFSRSNLCRQMSTHPKTLIKALVPLMCFMYTSKLCMPYVHIKAMPALCTHQSYVCLMHTSLLCVLYVHIAYTSKLCVPYLHIKVMRALCTHQSYVCLMHTSLLCVLYVDIAYTSKLCVPYLHIKAMRAFGIFYVHMQTAFALECTLICKVVKSQTRVNIHGRIYGQHLTKLYLSALICLFAYQCVRLSY